MKRDWIFERTSWSARWKKQIRELLSGQSGLIEWIRLVFERLVRRPLLVAAVLALPGALLATSGVGQWMIGTIAALSAIASLHRILQRTLRPRFVVAVVLFVLGGLRLGLIFGPAEQFRAAQQNRNWTGEAIVAGILSSDTASAGSEKVRVMLRTDGGVRLAVRGPQNLLRLNSRVNISGHLDQPDPAVNPGGFSERDWLYRQGVLLELNGVHEDDIVVLRSGRVRLLAIGSEKARSAISSMFVQLVGPDQAPLLLGLMVGDSSGLSREQEYHFRQAGLSHLTAVSGANIAFWLTPLTLVLRRFRWRRELRQIVLLLTLIAFGFLTGWQVSVTRAIIMSAVFLIGRLLHRRSDPLNALGLVILIFLIFSPCALLNFSFWLSLLATLGLLAGSPMPAVRLSRRYPDLPTPLVNLLSLNAGVQLLVLPVTMILSRQLSVVGLIANVPAVLLVEWITGVAFALLVIVAGMKVVGFLTGWMSMASFSGITNASVGIVALIGCPLSGSLATLDRLAVACSRWTFGRWPLIRINLLLAIGLLILIGLSFIRFRKVYRRQLTQMLIGCLIAGFLLANMVSSIWPKDQIWFLSVGQGDATLIQTREGQSVLIDCGKPNTGWDVVLPAMNALGIGRIDLLIITHGHSDHAGGVMDLLRSGRVKAIAVAEFAKDRLSGPAVPEPLKLTTGSPDDLTRQLINSARAEGMEVHTLNENDTIRLNSGHAEMRVLSPESIVDLEDLNEQALHFRLELQGLSILLMSDCTANIEKALLDEHRIEPADVLKVAHHGSKATTRHALIRAVQPRLAVISVGINSYGHPSPELLDRLTSQNVETLRTDRQGAIQLTISNGQASVMPFRKDEYG